jgi:hypothetical protein
MICAQERCTGDRIHRTAVRSCESHRDAIGDITGAGGVFRIRVVDQVATTVPG